MHPIAELERDRAAVELRLWSHQLVYERCPAERDKRHKLGFQAEPHSRDISGCRCQQRT
jgi:hypothetical protein